MSQPRIIGGSAKGRALEIPKHGTRPSPARLREALFNKLEFVERGSFLDLFSGSGAIALEAASRGWQSTCVDLSKAAANVIRRNAKVLGLGAEVVQGDALKFAETSTKKFDVVFAAPPYPLDLDPIFQTIFKADIVAEGGFYIFQHPSQLRLSFSKDGAVVEQDERKYGSNILTYIQN